MCLSLYYNTLILSTNGQNDTNCHEFYKTFTSNNFCTKTAVNDTHNYNKVASIVRTWQHSWNVLSEISCWPNVSVHNQYRSDNCC